MIHWPSVPVHPASVFLLWLSLPFWAWVLSARWRRREDEPTAGVARESWGGIVLQSLAITLAGVGPVRRAAWGDPLAWLLLAVSAAALTGMAVLFLVARRELGRNWSIVARTRTDHSLVTSGPYSYVRHPIYSALLLCMVAVGTATGHPLQLLVALPLFIWGTLIRVRAEERLLGEQFGPAHRDYVARVKAFVPGLI